jgi:hypothetical protein
MKTTDRSNSLKQETAQLIMALQDPDKLDRVRAVLVEREPTPQYILDLIDQRRAASKTEEGMPIEEFLNEVEGL